MIEHIEYRYKIKRGQVKKYLLFHNGEVLLIRY